LFGVVIEKGLSKPAPIEVSRTNEQDLFCHLFGIA
jgi:hypothetical protein